MALIDVVSNISRGNIHAYLPIDNPLVDLRKSAEDSRFNVSTDLRPVTKKSGFRLRICISGPLKSKDGERLTERLFIPEGLHIKLQENYGGSVTGELAGLFIEDRYRGNGIGSAVFDATLSLFRQADADKLYINAVDEGRAVWTKERFGMRFHESDKISRLYEGWRAENNFSTESYSALGNRPHLYPMEFIQSMSRIILERDV